MKTENRILFTSVPKLGQLKYFIGVFDLSEKPISNSLSDFNWQKIKTRRLLENHEDILAAPVQRRISQAHLIFSGGCSEREINDFVSVNKISLNGPHPLHNDIYLECILYTLTFKQTEWKRMNKYFLRGQNFLNHTEAVEAVRLQLLITDGCLAFSTWALRLKLPSMSLIDLGVNLKGLFEEGFAVVRQKVITLPNLKPATAICVHLKLPPSCCFRSYDEIKKHWMSLYGYNLPQNEEGMLFIEVTFNRSNFTYLYPIVCVCPFEPMELKCKDELRVINDFAEALRQDFPKICKFNLNFNIKQSNIFHPISKLYLASEVIDKPNLSLLVTDNKVIQDFQKENVLPMPRCMSSKRCRSPPLFFPSFERILPGVTPEEKEKEPLQCVSIFHPKIESDSRNSEQSKLSSVHSQSKKSKKESSQELSQRIGSQKYSAINSLNRNHLSQGNRSTPKRKRKE